MKNKKLLKQIGKIALTIFILIIGFIAYANWVIPHESKNYIFDKVEDIPAQKVGVVLGTSRYIGKTPNLYFTYRIEAAKELYESKKIKYFVVSGDNQYESYNEPRDMYQALTEAGIPDSLIYMDYAGFRTLDSVVRMKEIFEQKSYIVISQKFHNQRAIYIAKHNGIVAYGYNAQDLELNRSSYKTKIREVLARVKAVLDIITNKKPKFLGESIVVGE